MRTKHRFHGDVYQTPHGTHCKTSKAKSRTLRRMLAYERRVRDSTPDIRAAGKLIPRGHGAKECLIVTHANDGHTQTPERVKKFRSLTHPEPGQARMFRSPTEDPNIDEDICHGVKTKSSLEASELMNPPLKTKFQQVLLDQQEQIYNSKRKAPLGSSHDQSPGLPKHLNPTQVSFGLTTVKDESAGATVNPPKSVGEVDKEYTEGRELYKKSHNDWGVGEMVDRDYDWSKFTKKSLYGVPTPHDNSGTQVRDALCWLHLSQKAKKAHVVSKRLDDFRERTQPQLGQVHDPIAETLNVDDNHTFGVMVKADDFNAGELMHMEGPSTFQQCSSFHAGVLSSVRQHLKKNHFHAFGALVDALQHHDKERSGVIPAEVVRETFFQFNIPLTVDMRELLIRWCTDRDNRGVLYCDLVNLLDWKSQPDMDTVVRVIATPAAKEDKKDASNAQSHQLMSNYHTSSEMIKATVGGVPTHNYRTYGVPTIRSDLPAPRIRRVSDHTNYGDESDAYGLMYPSIYTNRGVYEEDFFKPRSSNQIKDIFESVGVTMTPEVFQELWQEAMKRDPRGQVSIESFRAIMEELQAQQLQS